MSGDEWDEIVSSVDRFSMRAYRAGVTEERERIIDLPFIHEGWSGEHRTDCVTCHNLALIKGENE